MERGGELWFWHVLALALGRTVGELQHVMTHKEFESWKQFYRAAPFDDLHRYHRPAAMVAQSMGGVKVGPAIDWLVNDMDKSEEQEHVAAGNFSEADMKTFAALGVKPPGVPGL